jgi:hypothetical protein
MTHAFVRSIPLLLAAQAAGQVTILYGVRGNGDIIWIHPSTGAGTLVGSSGVACEAAAAYVVTWGRGERTEYLLVAGGPGPLADQITAIGPGGPWWSLTTTGRPAGYTVRGLAVEPYWAFVVLSTDQPTDIDILARIDLSTGVYTNIGPTGRTDIEALAGSTGALYGLGRNDGGSLYMLDTATGQATRVGGGGFGEDTLALEFFDGNLLACNANLRAVNSATGAATLIGPTGFTDIRGLAAFHYPCYADCASGGPPPRLNVADFTCFLQRFAAGAPYCNCDGSTTPPVLNVGDFTCFLQRFAAGCP